MEIHPAARQGRVERQVFKRGAGEVLQIDEEAVTDGAGVDSARRRRVQTGP